MFSVQRVKRVRRFESLGKIRISHLTFLNLDLLNSEHRTPDAPKGSFRHSPVCTGGFQCLYHIIDGNLLRIIVDGVDLF